jgi:Zn-dependent protease
MTTEALTNPIRRSTNSVSIGALAGKLITVVLKFAKSTKVLLAFGTFTTYSFMFSWKFALLFLFGIGVHESGHVWAMRREGLKTKGFYFIPFFGGMAIPEEAFKTSRQETYIALMGPAFGIVTVAVPLTLSLYFRSHFWTAAASWLAFVNLFNLFPINPLDGGRVIKCIALSLHRKIGVFVLMVGFLSAFYLAIRYHMGLLWFIIFIGMLEVPILKVTFFSILLLPIVTIMSIVLYFKVGKVGFYSTWFGYIVKTRLELIEGLSGFKSDYWRLTPKEIRKYSLCFIGMAALFLAVILLLSGPGADITKEILKS